MAEITKWQANQVTPVLKHNMRHLEDGKIDPKSNDSIVPERTHKNYGFVDRGKTCKEINRYRKQIEAECFKYNRKNVVHALEYVFQVPKDCPPEQHRAFFEACHEFVCERLPMGERAVFVSQVHVDEEFRLPNGENISKSHLHIMATPAVPNTNKQHPEFAYKLCADDLTRRSFMRTFHSSLQEHINSKGIQATVFSKKEGDGKSIPLSVPQLKELSNQTGLKLEKSLTVNELAEIVNNNIKFSKEIEHLQSQLELKDNEILQNKTHDVSAEKEKISLQEQLHEKEIENQKIKVAAQHIIQDKNTQLDAAKESLSQKEQEIDQLKTQLQSVQAEHKNKELELQQANEKIAELESKKTIEATKEHTWGEDSWGSQSGWGNQDKEKNVEVLL